jgi:hypothetical protein
VNLDALFDDLEASFESRSKPIPQIVDFTPKGIDRAVFGKGFFTGFVRGTSTWRLTTSIEAIEIVPGRSTKTSNTLNCEVKRLVGLWLLVNEEHPGQLLAVESGFLIFRTFCVPIKALRTIEVRAVDNQKR